MAAATYLLQSERSSDKMDPAATSLPLSPTASCNGGQLPQGFDDLVHHNNATSYPREHAPIEAADALSASEHPDSRMSTPAPHAALSPHFAQYGLPQQQQQQQQQSVYTSDYTYQNQSIYDSANEGVYPTLPPDEPAYTTPASSPSQRSDMLSLRNGTVPRPATVPRPLASKSRVQKPKRQKRRDKSDKDKVILDKPLSEMGEEWKQSMIEIEAYINRPSEARRKEIDSDRKQPGKIKRPMNSFMLYRKAFQNHTKAYCEHNNHQVVSKVCGASWDQEPEHIRKQFADWAKLERANHQKAHPGYKFTPAKPKNAAKRKRDSDDEASDLESYDWESGQRFKRLRSHTGTPVPEHDLYPTPGYYPPAPQYGQHPAMMNQSAMLSSYGFNNPHKRMPAPYNSMALGQPGSYLSSNSMANHHYQQRGYAVEDVSYHKTPSPANQYQHPMQSNMMDQYVSTPQPHGLEHSPPPAQFMQNGHLEHGLYPVNDSSFDPNDPLQLPDHAIENTGLDFNFNQSGVQQPIVDGLPHDFGGENLLQDQHAQRLLRGNEESWDIQPLDEGQAGEQYEDWGVDPSLSQPYSVNDPSLSEAYAAHD